jgi:quercetin dioxygenase-like cupin family protein
MPHLITKPVVSTGVLRWYEGGTIRFLINSEETNGGLAVVETRTWKGAEPPRHIHSREDETFLIEEGEVTFFIGNQTINAFPGMLVFAPRGIEHHFKIQSETAKMFVIITPGGFEQYFWNNSHDAPCNSMPPMPGHPPTAETIQNRMLQLVSLGVTFV